VSKLKVDSEIWYRIHQILIEAKENSTELMNEHINNNGIITKKDRFISDMYEKEIREINSLLDYTSDNNGVPF